MSVLENLSEEECYLWAILSDPSGLDQAEMTWTDNEQKDGCFRAWPFQWPWWRDKTQRQIDQAARSVGKSLSVKVRAYAFPFINPGQEMVITAPEGNHLDAITDIIETAFTSNRLSQEMLIGGRNGIKHRPFHMNFWNGARIMGRIPQRDGKGIKGCSGQFEYILTPSRLKQAKDIVPGDMVLSHNGQWKKVTAVYFDENDCYEVRGAGSFPLTVSCDHRFYGAVNNADSKHKRDFDPLSFDDVECLLEDKFYWATPTKFPYVAPIYPTGKGKKYDFESEDFWWLCGLYVADGYLRKNGRGDDDCSVNWISHPQNKGRKKLIRALEHLRFTYRITERDHSSADSVEASSKPFAKWLNIQFGRSALTKTLPVFILSLPDEFKEAFLDGYLSGDGHWNDKKNRWECSSASKPLMLMVQLLAQSLGYTVNCTFVKPNVTQIMGVALKKEPETSWRLHISTTGHAHQMGDYKVNKVKKVTPVGVQPIVDIRVEDDHSYLSGSIMSHNTHPVWLEMDEAQDYPDKGWTEIIETLKMGTEGSMWRAHGVTRGLRDFFYEYTQPDSGWRVHRITSMHRPWPYWTDEERQDKIKMYGSRDHPDYRRNVLGLHGDATNPMFVLHRLMSCVDHDMASNFNQYEYVRMKINNEMVLEHHDEIIPLLDLPANHKQYKRTWIGMDVGYTNSPSVIVVFGEDIPKKGEEPRLKLLAKITLERISNPAQVAVILHLISFYEPQSFAMDKMQPISEPVLTPDGWVTMGDLRVGDEVIGSNGEPTLVTGVFPQVDRRVYQMTFDDGAGVRSGPEHLWTVRDTRDASAHTFTTEQLNELLFKRNKKHYVIQTVDPVVFADQKQPLPIDPYLLGVLIGDGNLREDLVRVSSADKEILDNIRQTKGQFISDSPFLNTLRELGLAGKKSYEKFIPDCYMTSAPDSRRELLRGLLDTDGWAQGPSAGFRTSSILLAEQVRSLVWSLGGKATLACHSTWLNGVQHRDGYQLTISLIKQDYFKLERKKSAIIPLTGAFGRRIRSIERTDDEESVCIRVEAEDHLYVTKDFVLTHNTGVGLPLFQDVQSRLSERLVRAVDVIKGYNFSEKILVDFDSSVDVDEYRGDVIKDSGIKRNVLEYSSDKLRQLVDQKRIWLPFDDILLKEFNGQTYTYKSEMDMYGRRKSYSTGEFHTLDATRMAVLGYAQFSIEAMTKEDKFEPVEDIFLY